MYLIKERVVSALSGAGFLDGVATHHLHDWVQLTTQQLACLQDMYTHLYTTVSVYYTHMYHQRNVYTCMSTYTCIHIVSKQNNAKCMKVNLVS